jgi:hypothetical protein
VADALTVVGAILQVVGLAFVFGELAIIRSLEFGVPTPWARVAAWVRRLLKRPKVVEVGAAMAVGASLSLHAKVRPATLDSKATLAEKVDWIERYMMRMDEDIDSVPTLIDNKAVETLQKAKDHSEGVRQQIEEREEQRRAEVRPSLSRQAVGAACVLLGTIAGTTGALWPDDANVDHAKVPPAATVTVTTAAPPPITVTAPAKTKGSTMTTKTVTTPKKKTAMTRTQTTSPANP